MAKSKETKPTNLIENAIGARAKKDLQKVAEDVIQKNPLSLEQTPEKPSPQINEQELRDLPIASDLEELNRQTEERLLNDEPMTEIPIATTTGKTVKVPQALFPSLPKTLASKLVHLPVIKTSSQESQPPQKSDWECAKCGTVYGNADALDDSNKCAICIAAEARTVEISKADVNHEKHIEVFEKTAKELGINLIGPTVEQLKVDADKAKENFKQITANLPAEDKDLVALKEYILDNGFVVAMVAMHIRMLCTSAMTTPSTTDWDFADRAHIPDFVFALLRKSGYLEGIWPSLRIVMGSNVGNPAWAAGIAMSIAFFDTIRVLPTLKELKK